MRLSYVTKIIFAGLISSLLSCGEDKSERKSADYSQEEDALQLTEEPLFLSSDMSETPKNLQRIEKAEGVIRYVIDTELFYNDAVKNRPKNTNDVSFTPVQSWMLQDEVSFSEKYNALVLKIRLKELGLLGKTQTYRFKDQYVSYRCENDNLAQFDGMSVTDFNNRMKKEAFCPNSTMKYRNQSNELFKYKDEEGNLVKAYFSRGESLPDAGFCSSKIVDENTASKTCGEYFHRYDVVRSESETKTNHYIFYKSYLKDGVYKANMNHFVSGEFYYKLNEWQGYVEYEPTGVHPNIIALDTQTDKYYQMKL